MILDPYKHLKEGELYDIYFLYNHGLKTIGLFLKNTSEYGGNFLIEKEIVSIDYNTVEFEELKL